MRRKQFYLVSYLLSLVLLLFIYNSRLYKQNISNENDLPFKYEPAVRDFYGYKCQEKIR